MKPMQIWLPEMCGTLAVPAAKRDRDRAFTAWNGQVTMWLLPYCKKPVHWQEGFGNVSTAIPAESLERVDIYHVDEQGFIFGPCSMERFGGNRIDGLLDDWLNLNVDEIKLYNFPREITVRLPQLNEHRVRFVDVVQEMVPRGRMPIVAFDESNSGIYGRWPPEGGAFNPVSPDAESEERFGDFELRKDKDGTDAWISRKDGNRTLALHAEWPGRFNNLFHVGDGFDVFYARDRMKQIARQSGHDPDGAIATARLAGGDYLSGGHSSLEWLWLRPALTHRGPETVLFEAEDHGFRSRNVGALLKMPDFRRKMDERVPIRRLWGPLGMFWALLLDRLESGQLFHRCQKCGRTLSGRKGKKFCSQSDNPPCFAERRAGDKQRSRRCNR
jgi:hypothetical protein